MNLPKKIFPNPVISATVEIRFESSLKDDEILSTFFPLLNNKFPKISDPGIPKEIKGLPGSEFLIDYVFSNDSYKVSVGKRVLSFEIVNQYNGWEDFHQMMSDTIQKIEIQNTSIQRIGVRYISLFNGTRTCENSLTVKTYVPFEGFSQSKDMYKTELTKGSHHILLQIMENAIVRKNDHQNIAGLYIDIDVSIMENLGESINKNSLIKIQELHNTLKTLFYSLLKKEFISSLNPEY